jgi:hypothetical protein
MMPAVAHVVAAVSTPIEPSASARTSLLPVSAHSRRRKLSANAATVAQNTDSIGEKPITMNTTTAISDRKWKP